MNTNTKLLNQPGDYSFLSICAAWHRCINDPSSIGMAITTKTDEHYESE